MIGSRSFSSGITAASVLDFVLAGAFFTTLATGLGFSATAFLVTVLAFGAALVSSAGVAALRVLRVARFGPVAEGVAAVPAVPMRDTEVVLGSTAFLDLVAIVYQTLALRDVATKLRSSSCGEGW